jgi:hypothetical protein
LSDYDVIASGGGPVDIDLMMEDFEYFCATCLKVIDLDRTKGIVPLVLKPVQKRLARTILPKLLKGDPVRIIILKARREGVSTVLQAIFFWVACTRIDTSGMTLSHHDDTTQELFGMTEMYWKLMPAQVRPMRGKSRRGQVLELANPSADPDKVAASPGMNSTLRTVTFKNAGAGQAANLVHCSEVALWGNLAKSTLGTLLPVVPFGAWTIIALESTARGVGNEFHVRWVEAEESEKRGDPYGFIPFFIPWFEEPEYTLTHYLPLGALDAEEEDLRVMGVSDDALAWRRYVGIPVVCGGDLDLFHQEYPATPKQAFLSTGRPFFDLELVDELLEEIDYQPVFQGNVHIDAESMRVVALPGHKGPLRIWQPPQKDTDYLLVCDPSEGHAHGDPQSIYITPRDRLEIVAAWHGSVPREDLGDVIYMLAWLYSEALVVVEMSGGWGHTPIAILRKRGYTRIYRRRAVGKKKMKASDLLGWDTTQTLRPLALDKLSQALRHRDLKVNDRELLEECFHFVYDEKGKPAAEQGHHDDRVLTAAVMCHTWQTTSKRTSVRDDPDDYQPTVGITGY